MKNGFWNYTEPVTYRVVLVKLHAVKNPPLHWQNAFVGTMRQAVEIEWRDTATKFYIDNGDGQGLFKAENRGGPEFGHRDLQPGAFEIVANVYYSQWNRLTAGLYLETEKQIEDWQKTNHPQEWEKMQALKNAWEKSGFNPRNATKR